jgi:RNA polymerase sigma-70 factor (ECF subfamily)
MAAIALGAAPTTFARLPRISLRWRAYLMTSDAIHPTRLNRLLLEAAAGDRAAFTELYDGTASLVFGIALRVVRDRTLAEDVAQEIYVELWRTAARFDPERGTAKAWITTMAHRRAVDQVRREQSQRDRRDRAAALAEPASADVATEVEDALDRVDVRSALADLTELQREAVELAYYGGLTYREVAERLGAPLGTVKTRMRDGLIRLGRALGVPDG